MQRTGMVRQLDTLGRVVIPIEIRRTLGIETKDLLNISVEGHSIILSRYEQGCCFCGSQKGLRSFKEKFICCNCLKALKAE